MYRHRMEHVPSTPLGHVVKRVVLRPMCVDLEVRASLVDRLSVVRSNRSAESTSLSAGSGDSITGQQTDAAGVKVTFSIS